MRLHNAHFTNHKNKPHETKTRNVRHQRLAIGHHFPCHLIPNPTNRKTLIMEITITKQHTHTINIPVPCFWTNGLRTIGLIDEKTVVSFVNYNDKTEVICASFDSMKIWIESTQTDDQWELMTEEDFFEAYDNAIKLITITPIIKTW